MQCLTAAAVVGLCVFGRQLSWIVIVAAPLLLFGLALSAIVAKRDKIRRSAHIAYDLRSELDSRFANVRRGCASLACAERAWSVPHNGHAASATQHLAISSLVPRIPARIKSIVPAHVTTNIQVWCVQAGRMHLFIFPDGILVKIHRQYSAVPYERLKVSCEQVRILEEDGVPSDSKIVGHVWKFAQRSNQDPLPEHDRLLPVAQYSQVIFSADSEPILTLHVSSTRAAATFATILDNTCRSFDNQQANAYNATIEEERSRLYRSFRYRSVEGALMQESRNPRMPHDILGVAANASMEEITVAYRAKALLNHPDKVTHMSVEFRELAERKMKEINAAYRKLLSLHK